MSLSVALSEIFPIKIFVLPATTAGEPALVGEVLEVEGRVLVGGISCCCVLVVAMLVYCLHSWK